MASVFEYGLRLLSWWRRPAEPPALRAYLSRAFAAEPFTDDCIAFAPTLPGVYMLYRSGALIYVGTALDASSIRQELEAHRSGTYGVCPQGADAFDFEITANPLELRRACLRG